MYSLSIQDDAREDLNAMYEAGFIKEAASIEVFLEQSANDQRILDTLLDHKFTDDNDRYSVSKWQELWRRGLDIWQIRVLDVPGASSLHRVIYAYDQRTRRFYILGVLHRDFDYNEHDDRSQRILRAYEELDIGSYY